MLKPEEQESLRDADCALVNGEPFCLYSLGVSLLCIYPSSCIPSDNVLYLQSYLYNPICTSRSNPLFELVISSR